MESVQYTKKKSLTPIQSIIFLLSRWLKIIVIFTHTFVILCKATACENPSCKQEVH